MTTLTKTAPPDVVWGLTNAAVPSRALHVVAGLGVADLIDDDPVSIDDLARGCAVEAEPLERLLRLLSAHEVFAFSSAGWSHTDASRLLRSDHPRSMRDFARMMGSDVFWASFGCLSEALHRPGPALETIEPSGLWSYLRAHPSQARIFDDAMRAKARADVVSVTEAYDFAPFSTIADIAGGHGHLLDAILERVPNARGVLFELPGVIESLGAARERVTYASGDFFVDELPAADLYLLMEVIHDWSDEDALAILRAVRRAAAPGASVLIIEGIIPDGAPDPRVQTLDVIMLAITGGRERNAEQLAALLAETGFRLNAVVPTHGPMRIVEAIAIPTHDHTN